MNKIAVVGSGLVGGSWAIVFARAGFTVALHDPSPAALEAALAGAHRAVAALAAEDLLGGQSADAVLARLTAAPDLAAAVSGAGYIQESAPERLAVKQALYRELDALAPAGAIIGSSTSGLPASAFTAEIAGRARCLVAHPINPPHLIPLVELVPAPWTAPEVVDRVEALMRQAGQSPIRLRREIDGFVANRLQSAVLAEAFRLVADGVCGVAEVDAAMVAGLGPRWQFIGPFETIDLNAQGGVADYCAKLGEMYYSLAQEQADPRRWDSALVAEVERQCRAVTPVAGLAARQAWRDRCLAALARAKRATLDLYDRKTS
jgi:3-hydroxyacyl-CoA dehydrogenase